MSRKYQLQYLCFYTMYLYRNHMTKVTREWNTTVSNGRSLYA